MRFLLCIVAACLAIAGCELEFQDDPCRCIQVTASDCVRLGVAVRDANGAPVTDLTFVAVFSRSGDTLTIFQSEVTKGYYIYVDDRYVPYLHDFRPPFDENSSGESIDTRGYDRHGTLRIVQTFIVAPDDCNCHVRKIFGPDSIVMQ